MHSSFPHLSSLPSTLSLPFSSSPLFFSFLLFSLSWSLCLAQHLLTRFWSGLVKRRIRKLNLERSLGFHSQPWSTVNHSSWKQLHHYLWLAANGPTQVSQLQEREAGTPPAWLRQNTLGLTTTAALSRGSGSWSILTETTCLVKSAMSLW